jgi:hypothetical protein
MLPPTLPPERGIPALEQLVSEAAKLRSESPDSPARQEWANTGESVLIEALGQGSTAVQAFGTAQCGVYGPDDTPQYRYRQANSQLDGMLAAMQSGIRLLRLKLPDPSHVFLPAGSPHDAYVEIRKIVTQATTELTIVDSYVDHTLWPLLSNIPPTTRVRILTTQMKGDFALEARKFIAQHGNTIEVRTTKSYHDRFIFVDGSKCWHLGASIKDAGNKAFAMSEIFSPEIVRSVRSDVENTWRSSVVVTL